MTKKRLLVFLALVFLRGGPETVSPACKSCFSLDFLDNGCSCRWIEFLAGVCSENQQSKRFFSAAAVIGFIIEGCVATRKDRCTDGGGSGGRGRSGGGALSRRAPRTPPAAGVRHTCDLVCIWSVPQPLAASEPTALGPHCKQGHDGWMRINSLSHDEAQTGMCDTRRVARRLSLGGMGRSTGWGGGG